MSGLSPVFTPPADRRNALDRAHVGDIQGALGTVPAFDTSPRLTARRKLATLLAILGPGVVVMIADNDAGTVSVFAQAGQNHGMRLLWVLLALCPALYVTQEMVARLGAVTGSGHARLTLERFGRVWCAFSVADLLVLNVAVLITEFIGVALALGYFGIPAGVSVPIAAIGLMAITTAGSFRRWERAMGLLIVANLALIPLALFIHPHAGSVVGGLVPALRGGPARSTVLLLLALVGTTIAPAQIFFQQSNVVDKRITPRWLSYERIDTAVGAILFSACAAAVLTVSAAALAGTPQRGHFTDAGAVTSAIAVHFGPAAGAVFAIALLDASLLGACVVSLSGSYAVSEVLGVKHSLHRSWRDARTFHACFAGAVAVAAAIVLIPHLPLGALTTLVQALAGLLVPSTLVLLLLLCNDTDLLGPLTNGRWLNAGGLVVTVGALTLSLMLALISLFPHVGIELALSVSVGLLALAAAALAVSHARERRPPGPADELTAWQRLTWSAPLLELLAAPPRTRTRVLTLAVLRVYIAVISVVLLLKLVGALPG